MSDPLQQTRTTIDALSLSSHPFQLLSIAEIRKLLPKEDKLQDRDKAAALIERSGLDVKMQRARVVPERWCADPELVKRLGGSKASAVWLASSSAGLDVRGALPRLLKLAQEMVDKLPVVSIFPGVQPAVLKSAKTKAFVGGGAHLSLKRVIEHGPKRNAVISRPPTMAEVVGAMVRTGRVLAEESTPQALSLSYDGRESTVSFNADADNGYPVGLNMKDPHARDLVLELAGGLRMRLEKAADPRAAVRQFRDERPEFAMFKGKAKTDLYNVAKVSGGQLRFYNTGGRHNVLIMQQATQPLSDLWKENARDNYRTFIGKGMARGGADALATYLDTCLYHDGIGWSHAGDDTIIAVKREVDGGASAELTLFSLDCTAFDLTQHSTVTAPVHLLFYQQLQRVDPVSAAMWYELMRERDVTLSGALAVRTQHWGASGMPLQSEVNDTLMEVLCARIAARRWGSKAELEDIVQDEGKAMGFKVRLEDFWQVRCAGVERTDRLVRWGLEKRPFLYVGYHLYSEHHEVKPQIDICRFMAGMPFLGGGYEADRAIAGVRAAITMAGYALSFGVPHPKFLPAYEVLEAAAIEAVTNKAREINAVDASNELAKYVYAGLNITVDSAEAIVNAIRLAPLIWLEKQGPARVVEPVVGAWADEPQPEPWEREFEAPRRGVDLGQQYNQLQAVGTKYAGTQPPTPATVLAERARAAQARNVRDEVVEGHFAGRAKNRDKRAGIVYNDDGYGSDDFVLPDGLYELD